MRRILPIELGINRNRDLKRQPVRRCQSIAKDYPHDESTLDALSILDGHVTAVDEGLLLNVPLIVRSSTTSEE